MREILLLGRRAVREAYRMPEATLPNWFIPIFFLVVNAATFGPQFRGLPFLYHQRYAAFALPVSLLFAASSGGTASGLALVTDIDLGYFDKLLVAPIRRTSILFGRLAADFVKVAVESAFVLLVGVVGFGVRIRSGVPGALLIVLLAAGFGVAYAGMGQAIALRSKNVQTVNVATIIFFPLLFLTPNFVPFDRLSPAMETLARINPISYVIVGLRSLVIDGWDAAKIGVCVAVIVGLGAILTALSLRTIANYNR